jgi:hypothetical protein
MFSFPGEVRLVLSKIPAVPVPGTVPYVRVNTTNQRHSHTRALARKNTRLRFGSRSVVPLTRDGVISLLYVLPRECMASVAFVVCGVRVETVDVIHDVKVPSLVKP